MPQPLTHKQRHVLTTLHRVAQTEGRIPSRRELARLLGYRSATSVQRHLSSLERKGYLRIESYKWRGARLVDSELAIAEVPLVGDAVCGTPILAEENIEDYIPVERHFLGHAGRRCFFLRARGDSMDLAGIDDGDLLLIDQRPRADAGRIVVALIRDEVTVKLFKPGAGYATLLPHSSNPEHRPILVSRDFSIQGVVRRVFKRRDLAP